MGWKMIESLKHLPPATSSNTELAQHFTDLAPALTARQAAIESARCLYCYDALCTRICPSELAVASFIRNIHDQNINGAAAGILKQNILGGSCARVCPTEILCEDACVRNHDEEGQPVKIGLLQRHALDNATFKSHPFQRAASTGKKVAIVGAGPAGLSDDMAQQLTRSGDKIHVDGHFRTALAGIYAGGDCVAPGQDLTVQAVQHGKLAALAIHNDIQSKVEAA
jgi:NADPH-dependent glutamate synthase beta subunit-like oxidoreductase